MSRKYGNINFICVVISIICFYTATVLYQYLYEKNFDFSIQHFGLVLFSLFLSSLLYFIGILLLFYISFHSSVQYKFKFEKRFYILLLLYSLISTSFTVFYTNNQNSSNSNSSSNEGKKSKDDINFYENHYVFNQLNYYLMVIFEIVYGTLTLLYFTSFKRNLKQFSIFLLGLAVAHALIVNSMLNYAKYDWRYGIAGNDKQMKIKGESNDFNQTSCSIESQRITVPWIDFVPNGLSNYLLESNQKCQSELTDYSRLTDNGYLMVFDNACLKSNQTNYTLTPDFFRAQRDHNVFEPNLQFLENELAPFHRTYHYNDAPVHVKYDETVLVQCPGKPDQVHFQNLKNLKSLQRAGYFINSSFANHPDIHIDRNLTHYGQNKSMNLLIINFDSLSRAHAKRSLTRTYKVLEQIQNGEVSEIFQFFRYHALKPFSDANSAAMYCGYNALHYSQEDRDLDKFVTLLAHSWTRNPMFYQSYRNDSYVKAWVNGNCADWFTNQFGKPHDGTLDHEIILPFCSPEMFPLKNPNGIQSGPYSYKRRCMGTEDSSTKVIKYIKQYWRNYKSVGKILTWNLMDSNDPTMDVLHYSDRAFSLYFQSEEFQKLLNDTVVVLTGTHGSAANWYYDYTDIGKLEASFPLLTIMFPKWFLEAHPEVKNNLKTNENRLATPLQLYYTLRYLSKYPEFGGVDMMDLKNTSDINGLLSEIPFNVTCKDLAIPHDFCSCK
ncbi:hypothetical protein DLAC_07541 [Tieghemostelium lacteum]|uniref:Uncharacterized protein n=1 Tax=Tieghemostelium lacteum TaxID=361077 RepID=A0A151ZCS6_TIELA|nr:hypothetical protein DLAC_07541 [Tieghemostelium lacteum]|eukprot:KYQ91753.1 hypothetical protein DLAC_07541 [Tieghemostelium lacteum]